MGAVSWRLVGWQAAFAGRLAPTIGWGQSVGDWSAGRPSSRAGSLLQLDGGSQLEIGRLAGRLREQARSYSGMGAVSWRLVGCQAVFASRLTPTVGMGQLVGDWSAVRPPSRAGSLLQLDGGSQLEIGRLSGRLRGQARSYNWTGAVSWRLVGWQAVFASRLAPTVGMGQSVGDWSAGRPSSRAGSLLQLDWVSQLEIGRLSGRLRGQARSYNWMGAVSWRLVGCQAVFASRLAPTVEWGQSVGNWSAVRPSSRAGSLLQLDGGSQLEIGRLSGRLREQARSYSGMGAVSWKLVGCQAVFASRLAPTVEWGQSVGDWSAVRPPSRAGSLLQLDWVSQLETGRLSGRHRQQAGSCRRAKAERMLFTTQWPSVSSPKALDLAVPAPSAG